MNDHTPGPWEYTNGKVTSECAYYQLICDMPTWGPYYDFDGSKIEAETLANARLIAAAPDLLDACEELMDFADRVSEETMLDSNQFFLRMQERARIAIARARGES